MTVEFHPTVQKDFNRALDHYEAEGGPHLADRFEGEFRRALRRSRPPLANFPSTSRAMYSGGSGSRIFRISWSTAKRLTLCA